MSHRWRYARSLRGEAIHALERLVSLFIFPIFCLLVLPGAAPAPESHFITLRTARAFGAQGMQAENAADAEAAPARASGQGDFITSLENFFLRKSFRELLADRLLAGMPGIDTAAGAIVLSDSTDKNAPRGIPQPMPQPGGSTIPQGFQPPRGFGSAPDSGRPLPKRPPADSTARAKFLTYEKKYEPVVPPFKDPLYPFFVEPSSGIERRVTVDSARNVVHIRELFNGKDIRIPLDLPLDEYIRLRYEYERNRRTREWIAKQNEKPKDMLGSIFKNLTEFEIPVPPNPLMSIFGNKNVVSLRITGAVDISAGFRSEKSDQQTVFLNPTQNTPTFKQQVQVNVNGMIGDKLSIAADWSTERTFEYENHLKIQYKGYEDEIIQNIEAGNVSLQTPSTLVGGSGALFGIKGEFQFGPLHLTAIASQKKGEGSRLSVSGGSQESSFEKHAYQFSENHFWIDTAYAGAVYENFFNYRARGSSVPITNPVLYIKDIEVWETPPTSVGVVIDPMARDAVAMIDLVPDGNGGKNPQYPAQYSQYIDPKQTVLPVAGQIEVGKFKKLQRDIDFTYNELNGIITLNQQLQDDQVLAVAYRLQGAGPGPDDDLLFGTFVNDQRLARTNFVDDQGKPVPPRLVLKLIKPRNLNPSFAEAWRLQVRSMFSLGARNLKKEDLESIRLEYRSGGAPAADKIEGNTLLQLFGLDQTDDNGNNQPDGKIDLEHVDLLHGEIIFPTVRPWDTGLLQFARALSVPDANIGKYLYPAVYDTTVTIARQSDRDKILLTGSTRGAASSTYQLGFNLVPGSVRVTLNGVPLTPNVDYRVDESVGMVTITKEEALVPGAKVDIDFERQDLFSFASKTLLGARGDVNLGKESSFGFTILNLNQKTLSDKVRIGEEPINNTIMGVDARTRVELPFITDALNRMPFLNTNEKSYLQIQGEAAMMSPNPNTKTSPIPSDNGAGIAYIDDFEGARLFAPLQTAYSIWKMASVPANHPVFASPDNPNGEIVDSAMQSHRARLNWYNLPISQSTVDVTQVWPNRKAAIENQKVNVLELEFHPKERGMYNYTPVTRDSSDRSWGGVMRLLPINAYNLVDGNFNFIEVWLKVETQSKGEAIKGKMMIDIGKFSEDVVVNRKLNSEDLVVPGSIPNGILNPGEDVGLDMLTNDEEKQVYAAEIAQYGNAYPDMIDDPSGDNYVYNPQDWSHFNGTEGNIQDVAGQFPDTEDLNTNSILDLNNSYFQYEVDLDTTKTIANTPGSYIVGGGYPNDSWFQFRIPITDFRRTIGSPSLTDVQYIRVWLQGVTDTVFRVRIADFNLVGNQWIERLRNDPIFQVSVVNIEDNPEYSSPPGVVRPRDLTRPDQNILGNEQSLALIFKDLPEDSTREAVRYYPSGIDLFNYRRLKMFVHGDPDLWYINPNNYAAESVLRIGVDIFNYYEYRQPIRPGWDAMNDIDIDFSKLTAIKPFRDSSLFIRADTVKTPTGQDTIRFDTTVFLKTQDIPVGNAAGSVIKVVGRPDLIRVNFISVGIHNPVNQYPSRAISGQIWVNELRVIDVKNDNGYAYQGSMNLRMADFADITATINHSDPYFHQLADRFNGTRSNTTQWSFTSTLNVDKALPKTWQGTQMRVTYTHSENLSKPLLLPGEPDVEVESIINQTIARERAQGKSEQQVQFEASKVRIASQTFEVRDSWAIPTVKLKAPGEGWLVQDVVNRIELSYNYSITRSRDPILMSRRQWQWTANAGYAIDLPKDLSISPFKRLFGGIFLLEDYRDWKLYYTPSRIGLTANMTRSRDERRDRPDGTERPFERLFEHQRSLNFSYTMSENGLLNLGGSYASAMRTSLLKLEIDTTRPGGVEQRQSSAIFNDIFFGRGGLYFGEPIAYTQQITLNSRPRIPKIFDLDRYFDLNGSYQVSYQWMANLQQGQLGRSAGYNSGATAQFTVRLKALFDPLFSAGAETGAPGMPRGVTPARRTRPNETLPPSKDSTRSAAADTTGGSRLSPFRIAQKLAFYLIKTPFLDYENISLSFNQNTTSTVSGVLGQSGFTNFWATGLFSPRTDADWGPSRFYQLGLIRTPNPTGEHFTFKSTFPFVGIEGVDFPGVRAANTAGSYVDNFSQSNNLTLKTNRDLWEGAKLDLSWDLKWQVNKNTQVATVAGAPPAIMSELTTSSLDRSFLMFPDFLFFSLFKTNMNSVNEKFQALQSRNPDATNDNLAQAFEEGFEAFPFLSKIFSGFLPRVNWGIRWDGVEKLAFLPKFADRISLEHRYRSTLSIKYRQNSGEPLITEAKRVGYEFSPLLGVTLGFNQLWGGDLTVNGSWRTQTAYDLNTSSSNIVQQGSTEISVTANFRKNGFDIPMFGIYLKNDLEFSLAFSTNKSSQFTYQLDELGTGGQPREGTLRITLEPRVRYVISQRVTASLFYRYQRTKPDAAVGSRIPGTTIHEGGLEIRLSITGT